MAASRSLQACIVVVVSLLASAASAAPSPSASSEEAPGFYRLAPDATAEKACTDKGGEVSTDADGNKVCSLPKSCSAQSGPTRTTPLDDNDRDAEQKCRDACGVVTTDENGAKACTRPE